MPTRRYRFKLYLQSERVFDHPTSERRNAFEIPRFGIGAITPDDVLVITRPHFRERIPGSTASVTAITDKIMEWKLALQTFGS